MRIGGVHAPRVYLLRCTRSGRTYVGAAIDAFGVPRRLRQHNGETRGGALRTSAAGPWVCAIDVCGFRTWSEALKFEFAWRRVGKRVRRWDFDGRKDALARLMHMERWSSTSPPARDVALTVRYPDINSVAKCYVDGVFDSDGRVDAGVPAAHRDGALGEVLGTAYRVADADADGADADGQWPRANADIGDSADDAVDRRADDGRRTSVRGRAPRSATAVAAPGPNDSTAASGALAGTVCEAGTHGLVRGIEPSG